MNSAPVSPAAIILLTALPPAPPTPITTMRGFMISSPSKALLEPLSHPPQIASPARGSPVKSRADGRIEGDLRQSHHRGKRRAVEVGRHSCVRCNVRDPYREAEQFGSQFAQPRLLA